MTDELKPCHEAFHDEQMTIWASEIIQALALTDALDFTTYDQKVEAFNAIRRELKFIGEHVAAWNQRASVQEAIGKCIEAVRGVEIPEAGLPTDRVGCWLAGLNECEAALRAIAEKAGE